jgi:hypothetical protein
MRNAHKSAAALLVIALAIPALAAISIRYIRHELFELAAHADVVVTGTIVDVASSTFDLRVERSIVGTTEDTLHVTKFVNWTCAGRWTEYAEGQRVLLFLERGADGKPFSILGGGGEGEMPLVGGDVIVRGYRVRGYAEEEHVVGGDKVDGARVALDEFAASIDGFRGAFTWRFPAKGYLPIEQVGPRDSMVKVQLFAATSKTARELVDEARSCRSWTGPHAIPDVVLQPEQLTAISCTRNGCSGTARVDPGRKPDQFGFELDPWFGDASALVGDVDGDGIEDLAVGAPRDSYLGHFHGALWIFFLDAAGGVRSKAEIREGLAGFSESMDEFSQFGEALAPLGDLDADGVPDLAVGAALWPKFNRWRGGVWVLFLKRDGTVARAVEVGSSAAMNAAGFDDGGGLGSSLTNLGDLDGDGSIELAIGQVPKFDLASKNGRCVFIASIAPSGEVVRAHRIQDRAQGLGNGWFGDSLARIGDVDGDGVADLAIADTYDNDGGEMRGAVWIAFLARDGSMRHAQKISQWAGSFADELHESEGLGQALAGPGDIDGDKVPDLLVASKTGVWTLLLNHDGTVKSHRKLENSLYASGHQAHFGSSLAVSNLVKPSELPRIACGGFIGNTKADDDRLVWLFALGRDGALRAK